MRYRTRYYPDYLRVLTASRVNSKDLASSGNAEVYYPGRLDLSSVPLNGNLVGTPLEGRPYIGFYDSANNERAVVALKAGDVYLPVIERTAPIDYSLETRIKSDYDLGDLSP